MSLVNENDKRNEWTVVIAIALVALGVWFLLGNIFGDAWREAIRTAFRLAWPIALIALGVLLLVTSRKTTGPASGTRLYRSREKMFGGVLGGIAKYFGIDPTILRVIYVVVAFLMGVWPAIVVYVVAMIIIPEEPKGADAPASPAWPDFGETKVSTPPNPSSGWPHSTGTETVQTPPPAPAPPAASAPAPPVPAAPEPPKTPEAAATPEPTVAPSPDEGA